MVDVNYMCRRYMAEILPIRRKTLSDQSIDKLSVLNRWYLDLIQIKNISSCYGQAYQLNKICKLVI